MTTEPRRLNHCCKKKIRIKFTANLEREEHQNEKIYYISSSVYLNLKPLSGSVELE